MYFPPPTKESFMKSLHHLLHLLIISETWFVLLIGHHGMIEGNIGFALYACENGFVPREGDVVRVTCVECNHNRMSWRAVKVSPNTQIINER